MGDQSKIPWKWYWGMWKRPFLWCEGQKGKVYWKECGREINQEFPFAHPDQIYHSSLPGSTLYDLFAFSVTQMINSWSVSIRQMWDLPVNSHKYLIEPLGGTDAYSMIISRFVSFLQNASKSTKLGVQLMVQKVLRHARTTTERYVCLIENSIGARRS